MDLANLPKYKLIMCDPQKYSNCDGMYKADDGNIVKFEDVVELLKHADNSHCTQCQHAFYLIKFSSKVRCNNCGAEFPVISTC